MKTTVLCLVSLFLFLGMLQAENTQFKKNGVWYASNNHYVYDDDRRPIGVIHEYMVVNSISDPYKGQINVESSVANPAPTFEGEGEEAYPVTRVNDNAFMDCEDLLSVSLPNSIKEIGRSAFANCPKLVKVNVPASVEIIPEVAFSGCTSLTNFYISDNVKEVGSGAFNKCASLTSMVVPNSVVKFFAGLAGCDAMTTIVFADGADAVQISDFGIGCGKNVTSLHLGREIVTNTPSSMSVSLGGPSLQRVTFSNYVTSIPVGAFARSSKLTDVELPSTVTEIPPKGFSDCQSLEYIDLSHVTTIGSSAFYKCSNLKGVIGKSSNGMFQIPDGVINIGSYAFCGCQLISTLVIPESCENIGIEGFSKCKTIKKVICYRTIPPTISENTFEKDVYRDAVLVCPNPDEYKNAKGWKNFFNIISLEEDQTSVTNVSQNSQAQSRLYNLRGQRQSSPAYHKAVYVNSDKRKVLR